MTPCPASSAEPTPDRVRSARVFRESVTECFAFLKVIDSLDQLLAASVPLADGRGWLVPVGRLHEGDAGLVAKLSAWRRSAEHAFPTRFEVTDEGTATWLSTQVIGRADRMLFLVTDRRGAEVGHVGLVMGEVGRALELDNIVRGRQGVELGIMGESCRALISWAEETLWPDEISLRVLTSNASALRFYEQLGFVERDREAMAWEHAEGSAALVCVGADTPADDALATMVHDPTPRTSFDQTILTSGPSISGRENAYALDAARNGWMRQWSVYLDRFERTFAEYIGTEYAMATSSCTGALHIAMMALGIGPGDEVIVPDLTWVATAKAVQYVGATPVFADIQADTMCIDPAAVPALVTPRTKAIIPVHLYGHPAEMDEIMAIAERAGLYVVEDAAPAIGAEHRGRRVGTYGHFAAFSFQGAKLLSTGEGGALVTSDPELYERALKIWDQGRNPDRAFWIDGPGVKYKMSNVQAALGLGQIERADAHVEAKRRLHDWYAEDLAGIRGITLLQEAEWARSIHWMNSVVTDDDSGKARERLRLWLTERNVDSRVVFPSISEYPIWDELSPGGQVSRSVAARGLNLPSGLWMRRDHVRYVATCIREFAENTEGYRG